MNYLITGGAGFIGSHLIEELLPNNELLVVDDLSSGKHENIPKVEHCTFVQKKIQEMKLTEFPAINGIFHLAAQASVPVSISHFRESCDNNLLGTLMIFEIARKLSVPVVYASSSAVYGNLSYGDDTQTSVALDSPYAVDKYCMENYAKLCHKLYGVSCIGLRFFNVYGPRQDPRNPYSGVISIFIDRVLSGSPVTVNGGYQTRDFVYVKDVVKTMRRAMGIAQSSNISDVINVGTGASVTIDYLLDLVSKDIGKVPEIIYQQLPAGDPEHSSGIFDKLKTILGIDPQKFAKLDEGLQETIKYLTQL